MSIKKGIVLLAQPFMLDQHFSRSAVLLCEHNDQGSLGFILNKPVDIEIQSLFDEFPDFDANIFYGGPVSTNSLQYIHRAGDLLEDSLEIIPGVYWGGDFEKLKFLIESELIKSNDIRFFLGYSGWVEGQLKEELEKGSWIISDMDANYAFKSDKMKLWRTILENKGDNYRVIAQMPDFISLN